MIRNICVKNHKGITRATISNLGIINVLAGRNNSGKSSVLEAITQWKHGKCEIGEIIDKDHISTIIQFFRNHIKQYSNPHPDTATKALSDALSSLLGNLVYEGSIEELVDPIYNQISAKTGRHNKDVFKIKESLDSIFNKGRACISDDSTICLIPAKRHLDRESGMNFGQSFKFEASGRNIISHLFYLKNQPVSSDHYKLFLRILDAFSTVTEGLEFNLVPTQEAKLTLFFSDSLGQWFPADDCGLGLQDLLVIVSFLVLSPAQLILIEEPENHIHPDKQRRLLSFLKSFGDRQFILATHSSVFLDVSYIDRAIFVERCENQVKLQDRTNRASLLKSLGYSISDNIGCDLIVLTEGPNDGPVLEVICRKLGFWEDFIIRFWPLGGDNMARFDFNLICESYEKNRVIALIDKDPKSKKARQAFQEKCREVEIECIQLSRYAVENYVTFKVINECRELNHKVNIDSLMPQTSVEKQVGFSIKKWLPILFESMTLEELEGTDLLDFCSLIKKKAEMK